MKPLSLAHQTMFADLIQKCLDAEFDQAFPENGSFSKVKGANSQLFWYYKGYRAGSDVENKRFSKYVGPVSDPAVTARVEQFRRVKAGYRERRSLVASLIAAGLPSPPALAGDVVEVLWKAGLFRLHGVLVGTVAFQTYAGLLGIRLPNAALMTADVDIAQFHSVSVSVEDSIPPVLDALRQVDQSFREIPNIVEPRAATAFVNATGFKVEFRTPNRSRDEYGGRPAPMPALGGASAQPLRYLDFLIHQPVRSALLHKGGIAVLVPAPERFAVHKLILSEVRREGRDAAVKARKDHEQAAALIEALAAGSGKIDLGFAWIEACERGPRWRDNLAAARRKLPRTATEALRDAIGTAEAEGGPPVRAG
jgi:hypothetical protein